jgi:AraC family transcriptional regulator
MAHEIAHPDAFTSIALEGLALELLAVAARACRDPRHARPPWLARAEDLLRARFADPLTLADVARECGVHPAHLARVFRQHNGCSVGDFQRARRLEWAAAQLEGTSAPISLIALQAGFTDQSHFTHRFREQTGVTPNRWRRLRASPLWRPDVPTDGRHPAPVAPLRSRPR